MIVMKKNQFGRSMVELLCVLVVALLIMTTGLQLWKKASFESQAQTISKRVLAIKNTRQVFIDVHSDKAMTRQQALNTAVLHAYDIRKDAEALRNAPDKFEFLRGSYWIRREFSAYTVHNAPEIAVEALQMLGFKTL